MSGSRMPSVRVVGVLAVSACISALLPATRAPAAPRYSFAADRAQPVLPSGSTLAAVADVNGDGIPDLVVESIESDTVGVMLGDGTGGFGAVMSTPLGARPVGVHV